MDDNYIEIEIYGYYFVIPTSRFNDLAYISNKLVNVSNTQLVGVGTFRTNSNLAYPKLTCNAMSQCQIWTSSQYSYDVDANYVLHDKFNMNTLGISNQNNILIFLLTVLVGVKLLWKR